MNRGINGRIWEDRRAIGEYFPKPPAVKLAEDCVDFTARVVSARCGSIRHRFVYYVESVMTNTPTCCKDRNSAVLAASDNVDLGVLAAGCEYLSGKLFMWVIFFLVR